MRCYRLRCRAPAMFTVTADGYVLVTVCCGQHVATRQAELGLLGYEAIVKPIPWAA